MNSVVKIKNSNMFGTHGGYRREEMACAVAMNELQTFYIIYRSLDTGFEAAMTVEATGEESAKQRVLHDIREEEGERVVIEYIRQAPYDFDLSPLELASSITAQRDHSFQAKQRVFWDSEDGQMRGIYKVTGTRAGEAYLERKGLHDIETHVASMNDLFLLEHN